VTDTASTRPSRRGRGARRDARTAYTQRFLPEMERGIPYLDAILPEQVDIVHDRTMTLLETTGIEFRDDDSIEMWRRAGAGGGVAIDGHRLRIDREFLMECIATAPAEYTMIARDPERTVTLGGRKSIFTPAYGAPFVRDLDGTRRNATLDDFDNFAKIAQMTPAMQMSGGVLCEPMDIAVPHRHLHMTYSLLKHSTKPFMGAVTSRERAEDSLEMARLLFGEEFVDQHTVMTCLANGNSPLVWDESMLGAAIVYARAGQPVYYSPFALAGANTPASTVGGIAQLNAEALAGCAFAQAINPGSPTIYGMFLMIVDMRSGAPMTGTPDLAHMLLMAGQLARFYNLPVRSVGMHTGSKALDAQAGYEANMNMHAAVHGGINLITHCGGWMEHGLTVNLAKYCTDADIAAGWLRYAQGPRVDDFDDAMQAVREVGPAGHYLGAAHTVAHYTDAFHMPNVMDQTSFEQWEEAGAKNTEQLGWEQADALLASYEKPPIDDSVEAELLDFVARRMTEIPEDQTP